MFGSDSKRTITIVVNGNSSDGRKALAGLRNEVGKTHRKFGVLGAAAGGLGRVLGRAVKYGSLAAVGGITAAGVVGIKVASQMEQATIGFTTMLGSGKKAHKFLDELKVFAAKTPFEFPELVQASQKLLAMGFAAKDVKPTLTAIGDAASGLGIGADGINRITLALGQMQAKGKVSGEEIRQLTEAGIPAIRYLADAYDVTTAEMFKMVEQGEVLSEEGIPAIIEGMQKGSKSARGFGGLMEKQSKSLAGLWSTLKDNVQLALGDIAAAFFPLIKKAFPPLIDLTGKLGDWASKSSGKIQGLIDSVGGLSDLVSKNDFISKLRNAFAATDTGERFAEIWEKIKNIAVELGPILASVIKAVGRISAALGITAWDIFLSVLNSLASVLQVVLVPIMKVLDGVLQQVAGWLEKNTTVAYGLGIAFAAWKIGHVVASLATLIGSLMATTTAMLTKKAVMIWDIISHPILAAKIGLVTAAQWLMNAAMSANPIGLVVIAIGALVAAFVILWKKSEGFRNFWKKTWDVIQSVIQRVWNWIKDHWKLILGILTGPIGLAVVAIVKHRDKIVEVFKKAINWIKETWKKGWEGLKNTFRALIRKVVDIFLWLVEKIVSGAAKAFGWIPGIGGKLKKARDDFKKFRKNVNDELGAIKNKSITIKGQADIKTHGKAVYVNGVRVAGSNYAEGGFWNHENHVAQVSKAGAYRVWAEDETGGEAYIPLGKNKRKRSVELLHTVASMFGYELMSAANGAIFDIKTSLPVKPWRELASRFNKDSTAVGYAIALMKQAASGFNPGLAGALNWARTQRGKPYIWGGVGPAGYDCSGFMSAITNVIQGRSPYQRRFSSATLPAGLFSRGPGAFMVGWFRGNPGHVAGTLNGVNVESAGGVGVRVGPSARGARSSMFTSGPWHLKGYDAGGWLEPGWTLAYNGTGQPERVTPGDAGEIHLHFHGPIYGGDKRKIAQELAVVIRDELRKHGDRNGGRTGL